MYVMIDRVELRNRKPRYLSFLKKHEYSEEEAQHVISVLEDLHSRKVLHEFEGCSVDSPVSLEKFLILLTRVGLDKPACGAFRGDDIRLARRMGMQGKKHPCENLSEAVGKFVFSNDEENVDRVINASKTVEGHDPAETGRALGYPEAAVREYVKGVDEQVKGENERVTRTVTPEENYFFEGDHAGLDDPALTRRGKRVRGLMRVLDDICGTNITLDWFKDKWESRKLCLSGPRMHLENRFLSEEGIVRHLGPLRKYSSRIEDGEC